MQRIYAIDLAHDATVGERSRNSKFSYVSPRSIYGETSNEGKETASTYPCRSLSGSIQENGVEGVVLVVIQISGDPSAERVGERSRNSKFSYVSPRSIYGETSNEGKETASTYPCRSLSGSIQENGVEGVVLVVIQISGDPSAERTAPPRSTHVQPGDVSHALIQQGERERLGKTPSSSSTTAWW